MTPINRRHLIQGLAALTLPACSQNRSLSTPQPPLSTPQTHLPDWSQADKIANDIHVPRFRDQIFDIRNFGAKANSPELASQAIAQAIDACHNAGGGRVLVAGGVFQTGAVHLKSNVELHIAPGATLRFSSDPKHYLPAVFSRWEGVEYLGYSPLIYAYEADNIAITGRGTLEGGADRYHWWPWKGNQEWGVAGYPSQAASREQLFTQAEAGVPPHQRVYARGHYFRPPFIQPYRCNNVLIEEITVTQSPFWLINPVLCSNVTVRGVHLESLGPNSDGCNPESCRGVLIEDCYFDTGDDCIAIKSGRNNDGRRLDIPSENIVIRRCKMRAGHGGVVIGSEISGGVRNVFAEDCEMSSPDLERGFRIKTNSVRGGTIENIHLRNCEIGQVKDAVVINFYYEEGDAGQFDPTVRNITLSNITCHQAQRVFQVRGFERAPIQSLTLHNCDFKNARALGIVEHVSHFDARNVKINGAPFPRAGD